MVPVCSQDENFSASVSFPCETIKISDVWFFWEETENNNRKNKWEYNMESWFICQGVGRKMKKTWGNISLPSFCRIATLNSHLLAGTCSCTFPENTDIYPGLNLWRFQERLFRAGAAHLAAFRAGFCHSQLKAGGRAFLQRAPVLLLCRSLNYSECYECKSLKMTE